MGCLLGVLLLLWVLLLLLLPASWWFSCATLRSVLPCGRKQNTTEQHPPRVLGQTRLDQQQKQRHLVCILYRTALHAACLEDDCLCLSLGAAFAYPAPGPSLLPHEVIFERHLNLRCGPRRCSASWGKLLNHHLLPGDWGVLVLSSCLASCPTTLLLFLFRSPACTSAITQAVTPSLFVCCLLLPCCSAASRHQQQQQQQQSCLILVSSRDRHSSAVWCRSSQVQGQQCSASNVSTTDPPTAAAAVAEPHLHAHGGAAACNSRHCSSSSSSCRRLRREPGCDYQQNAARCVRAGFQARLLLQ